MHVFHGTKVYKTKTTNIRIHPVIQFLPLSTFILDPNTKIANISLSPSTTNPRILQLKSTIRFYFRELRDSRTLTNPFYLDIDGLIVPLFLKLIDKNLFCSFDKWPGGHQVTLPCLSSPKLLTADYGLVFVNTPRILTFNITNSDTTPVIFMKIRSDFQDLEIRLEKIYDFTKDAIVTSGQVINDRSPKFTLNFNQRAFFTLRLNPTQEVTRSGTVAFQISKNNVHFVSL